MAPFSQPGDGTPNPFEILAHRQEANRAAAALMTCTCPLCGATSRVPDPRVDYPLGKLGLYHCVSCGQSSVLQEVLEAADDRALDELLGPS